MLSTEYRMPNFEYRKEKFNFFALNPIIYIRIKVQSCILFIVGVYSDDSSFKEFLRSFQIFRRIYFNAHIIRYHHF